MNAILTPACYSTTLEIKKIGILIFFNVVHFLWVQMVKKREEIVSKKEAILSEKSELEMKKLRSSQVINKVTNQLSVSRFLWKGIILWPFINCKFFNLINFLSLIEHLNCIDQTGYSGQDDWWEEPGTNSHTSRGPAKSEGGAESVTGQPRHAGEEAQGPRGEAPRGQTVVSSRGAEVGV